MDCGVTDNLRTRIAQAIYDNVDDYMRRVLVRPSLPGAAEVDGDYKPTCYVLADAVIRELTEQWRADFGYDGYAECETRDEAKAQVADFNAALGDDVRDGEQAMVMHRYVTEWESYE